MRKNDKRFVTLHTDAVTLYIHVEIFSNTICKQMCFVFVSTYIVLRSSIIVYHQTTYDVAGQNQSNNVIYIQIIIYFSDSEFFLIISICILLFVYTCKVRLFHPPTTPLILYFEIFMT